MPVSWHRCGVCNVCHADSCIRHFYSGSRLWHSLCTNYTLQAKEGHAIAQSDLKQELISQDNAYKADLAKAAEEFQAKAEAHAHQIKTSQGELQAARSAATAASQHNLDALQLLHDEQARTHPTQHSFASSSVTDAVCMTDYGKKRLVLATRTVATEIPAYLPVYKP